MVVLTPQQLRRAQQIAFEIAELDEARNAAEDTQAVISVGGPAVTRHVELLVPVYADAIRMALVARLTPLYAELRAMGIEVKLT